MDDNLGDRDKSFVASHVAGCESCRREVEQTRKLVGKLGGFSGNQAPYDLWSGVSERIVAEQYRRRGLLERLATFAARRIIAVPVAVATASVIVLLAHPGKDHTPEAKRDAIAESTAEYKAYMQAYSSFRSRQALSDPAAIAAAAQLQHNNQGAP